MCSNKVNKPDISGTNRTEDKNAIVYMRWISFSGLDFLTSSHSVGTKEVWTQKSCQYSWMKHA